MCVLELNDRLCYGDVAAAGKGRQRDEELGRVRVMSTLQIT